MYSRKVSRKLTDINNSDEDDSNGSSSYFDSDESLSEDDEREVSLGIVGEIYSNKYICIKYLGKGTFSRVWLVYDIITESFCAMKVIYSKYKEEAEHEIEMYKKLGNKYNHVTKYIDSFLLNDEICIVTELMGICLIDLFKYYSIQQEQEHVKRKWYEFSVVNDLIPREIVKKIFKDLFIGLHELHRKGIVHTDIKPENVMVNIYPNKIIKIKEWFLSSGILEIYKKKFMEILPDNFANIEQSKRKLVKKKCRIKALNLITNEVRLIVGEYHKNNRMKETEQANNIIDIEDVSDIEIDTVSEDELFTLIPINEITAKIIDLGNAELIDNFDNEFIQLRCYRPPENILHEFFNTKADIWSMGCVFFETLTGDYLFDIDHEKYNDSLERDRELLVQMYNTLGEMKIDDVCRSMYKDDLFIKNSNKIKDVSSDRLYRKSIRELLRDSPAKITGRELDYLTNLFNSIFEYDLDKRSEAAKILEHSYFKN